MTQIAKVAVIGAGTMGSGIASHVTNAGIPVLLLDVVPAGAKERNQVAQSALKRLQESAPPAFMDKVNSELITIGNIEDDFDALADVDWIAEAVVERLDVKKTLYRQIEQVRKPGALVSSNTSTIPLKLLTEGMSAEMRADFCITHFFNPVRYMRLLELVGGPHTNPRTLSTLNEFCDVQLGKGVVVCNDTPGFLGNRVGVYALQVGITQALVHGLTIEEADAVMGRPMGIPKTGVFGLYDLIGLDLMLDVAKSLATVLPSNDPFQEVADGIALIPKLCADGFTGNKGKGGFYRSAKECGESVRQAIDLQSGDYRPTERFDFSNTRQNGKSALRSLVERNDKYGQFAWSVLSRTLNYAASLVPGTSEDVVPIDEAMKLGYGWLQGPFEMIDEIGLGWFVERARTEGLEVAPILSNNQHSTIYRVADQSLQKIDIDGQFSLLKRADGVERLSDLTLTSKPLLQNEAASFWDVGDDIGCIEFHSKANALSPTSMDLVARATVIAGQRFKGLIIHNDAPHFSVGFNLDFALDTAKRQAWDELDQALEAFQNACLALKYLPIPVVAAPSGLSLGGGYEVVVHCDRVQAHANSVMGLVETIVGLIPSGGGCKEMLHRWTYDTHTPDSYLNGALKAFEIVGMGKTGTSPIESERLRFHRPQDGVSMNRDRLLFDAKRVVRGLMNNYHPPTRPTFTSLGDEGEDAMHSMLDSLAKKGLAKAHDITVGKHLANILCITGSSAGSSASEAQICELERANFISLIKSQPTIDRIEHMLRTGRALRN